MANDELAIPDDVTPADIVGETEILPGQEWLDKAAVLFYARQMISDKFPWELMQDEQPMAIAVGLNGTVITQGHHRFVAARLAKITIPVEFDYHHDYLEQNRDVPFAKTWDDVKWE